MRNKHYDFIERTEEMNSFPIWLNMLLFIIGLITGPTEFICWIRNKEIPDFE